MWTAVHILPFGILASKSSGAGCWAFFSPVFPSKVYHACPFSRYFSDRYKVAKLLEKFFDVKI